MIQMTAARDIALLAVMNGEPYQVVQAHLLLFTMADGLKTRFICQVYDDYEPGWAESAMVEAIVERLPEAARFKLQPSFRGPCIVALGDEGRPSRVGYFALYPQVGVPVTALPGAVNLDWSAEDLCSAVLEQLEAISASTSLSCHLQIDNLSDANYLIDVPNKRIWMIGFGATTLVWSDHFGTSVMSSRRLNLQEDLPLDNTDQQLEALISVVKALVDFPHNSAKIESPEHFQPIADFLASKKNACSLKKCIAFFKDHGELLDHVHTSVANFSPASNRIPSATAVSPPRLSNQTNLQTQPQQQLSSVRGTAEAARSIAAIHPKYTKAVAAAAPVIAASLETKQNPVGALNDVFQKLTGASPQFKDEGRIGGADHVPRFSCGFQLPNGEYLTSDGSSKQEAKTNVAIKVLEALARMPTEALPTK